MDFIFHSAILRKTESVNVFQPGLFVEVGPRDGYNVNVWHELRNHFRETRFARLTKGVWQDDFRRCVELQLC